MKKLILLLLFITLFLFKIDSVNAITSNYTYDISLGYVIGDHFYFEGWAYLTKNGTPIHNINPIYTMQLVGEKADGSKIYSDVFKDNSSKPSYSGATDTPNDSTKPYFNKVGSLTYPDTTYTTLRADRVKATLGNGNRFAINLNFSFDISVNAFFDLANRGAKKIYMYLTSTLSYPSSTITVYGQNFNVVNHSQTIPIAIQKDYLLDFGGKFASKGFSFNFQDSIDEVTVISTYGQVRNGVENICTRSGYCGIGMDFTSNYYYYYKSSVGLYLHERDLSLTPVYYNNLKYSGAARATYKVTTIGETYVATISHPVRAYQTTINNGVNSCRFEDGSTKNCVTYNSSGLYVWIPAFWVSPIEGSATWIEVKKDNECEGKTGKDLTCCLNDKDPICLPTKDPCEGKTGRDLYCCQESKDPSKDPLCSTDICVDKPEEGFYCKDDDENKENKKGSCEKDTSSLSINFRYPDDGSHKTVLTNEACTISCQENLKLTFQPGQSVRAGMGFTYPVTVNGARTCIAAYSNNTWIQKMNAAVTAAQNAVKQMKTYLKSANTKSASCGTKTDAIPTSGQSYVISAYTSYGSCSMGACGVCAGCSAPPACATCGPNHEYTGNFNAYAMSNTNSNSNTVNSVASNNSSTKNVSNLLAIDFSNRNLNIYPMANTTTKTPPKNPCQGITPVPCPSPPAAQCPSVYCTVYSCSGNKRYWDDAQSDIKSDLDKANEFKAEYESQKAIIDKLNSDRGLCDDWVNRNEYLGNPAMTVTIDGDAIDDQSSYVKVDSGNYKAHDTNFSSSRTIKKNYPNVLSCTYGPHGENTSSILFKTGTFSRGTYCLSVSSKTEEFFDYWAEKSTRTLTYKFSNQYYVQDYSGEYNEIGGNGYQSDGNKEYTSFYAAGGKYDFKLKLNNVGPNIPNVPNNLWSISPYNCYYNLRNLIFPPENDEYTYPKYGSMAFMYRQIALSNVFPERDPGWNWGLYWDKKNNTAVTKMQEEGNDLFKNDPEYTLTLNPNDMVDIASYNKRYGYSSFNQNNPYRSDFLNQYAHIIVGGRFK